MIYFKIVGRLDMMYIKSFVTELTKKIETVELQLKEFESKMEKINSIKKILTFLL